MRRSEKDLSSLLDDGARVRLVKGAYREDDQTVFAPGKRSARTTPGSCASSSSEGTTSQ